MYSLHEIDRKLFKYLNYKNGFFVECGANDGVTQSNTLLLEQELQWTGLLVEPGYVNYNKCRISRSNCIVENYALVSCDYQEKTINGNFNNDLCNGLMNSIDLYPDYFDSEMIFWADKFRRENKSETTEVNCCTLQHLLDKHLINKIDFFSLDVEGYEIEVLKGLDLKKIRPVYILIETTTSDYYKEIVECYMTKNDYILVDRISINDALYMDNLNGY